LAIAIPHNLNDPLRNNGPTRCGNFCPAETNHCDFDPANFAVSGKFLPIVGQVLPGQRLKLASAPAVGDAVCYEGSPGFPRGFFSYFSP
jgi:hypothetical protein